MPIAAMPLLLLLLAGVVFHGRDAVRRQPGALYATGLAGVIFAASTYLVFTG